MKQNIRRLFFLYLILLPTQLGYHFWFDFSLVLGRRIDYLSPALYFVDLVLIVIAIGTYLYYCSPTPQKLFWTFAAIGIVSVISLIVSPVKILSLYASWRLFLSWLVVWVFAKLLPDRENALTCIAIGIWYSAGLALAQFFAQHSLQGFWYWLGERAFDPETPGIAQLIIPGRMLLRPYSTLPHPNVLGGMLAALLPLYLFTVPKTTNSSHWYIVRLLTLAFIFIGVFISFSRIAWVAVVCVIGWWVWNRLKTSARQKKGILLFLLFTSVGIFEEATLGRFINLFNQDAQSVWERTRLAGIAVKIFLKGPIFGSGLLQFIPQIPQFSSPPYLLQPVHSIYLLLLAETGLGGLFFFLYGFKKLIDSARKNQWSGMIIGLLVVGTLGVFDHYFLILVQGQRLLGALVGLSFFTLNNSSGK